MKKMFMFVMAMALALFASQRDGPDEHDWLD